MPRVPRVSRDDDSADALWAWPFDRSSVCDRLRLTLCKKVAREAMAQCGSGVLLCLRILAAPRLRFRLSGICVVIAVSLSHALDDACRPDCGACCIAPSITSPIPGMPQGKPAGVRCVQLGDDLRCAIFGRPERPACCSGLQPQPEMCGTTRVEALAWLTKLERDTQPAAVSR